MSFSTKNYLSWYIPRIMRGDDPINLHASGMAWAETAGLELPDVHGLPCLHALEERLADWLGIPADELVYTPGATGGTLLALLELVSPGGSAVVEEPIYEPMLRQSERLATTRRFARGPATDWRLPLGDIGALLDDRTGLVMITEPHNPSGVSAPRDEVLELARLAAERGAMVLVNEIYRGFGDAPSYHGAAENLVVVGSLSKLIGVYGTRLGWLSAPAALAGRLRDAHWNTGIGSVPGAREGLAFLTDVERRRSAAREIAAAGLPVVDAFIKGTAGLSWVRPAGSGFGCVSLPAGVDDARFAERLHDERGVLVVPGTCFGLPGTMRVSWLQAGDRLAEGLAILGEALAKAQSVSVG